jgi:hypothetical protein
MTSTEKNRLLIKQIIFIVSAHTVAVIVFSHAHQKIDLIYSLSDYMPMLLIQCFVPLAAALFLTTQAVRQGAVTLLGALSAELIYNIYTRFTAKPPLSREEINLFWKIVYESSFGVVLILEVLAYWLTMKVLIGIHNQSDQQAKNSYDKE